MGRQLYMKACLRTERQVHIKQVLRFVFSILYTAGETRIMLVNRRFF